MAGPSERSDELVVMVADARRSLDSACRDLDDAVLALTDTVGDDVMASPGLVALLLRVVAARRHLTGVQAQDPSRWV